MGRKKADSYWRCSGGVAAGLVLLVGALVKRSVHFLFSPEHFASKCDSGIIKTSYQDCYGFRWCGCCLCCIFCRSSRLISYIHSLLWMACYSPALNRMGCFQWFAGNLKCQNEYLFTTLRATERIHLWIDTLHYIIQWYKPHKARHFKVF